MVRGGFHRPGVCVGLVFCRLVCVLVCSLLYSDSCSVSLSGSPNLHVGVDPTCGPVRYLAFLCVTLVQACRCRATKTAYVSRAPGSGRRAKDARVQDQTRVETMVVLNFHNPMRNGIILTKFIIRLSVLLSSRAFSGKDSPSGKTPPS